MTIDPFHYPTRNEIDACVRAARRDRAEAIARLFRDAANGLTELFAHGLPVKTGARARRRMPPTRISSTKEVPMTDSFWKTAAASLPPQVQSRYRRLFETAEEFERMVDYVLTARGSAYRALARACRGLADALSNAARTLDVAARRLTPTR
ncbi:MAG TPA: hypothetical protein VLB72_01835 [Burkholderiales bacterium]|nr:hypothetical protein [Burkholderiales bacterium]